MKRSLRLGLTAVVALAFLYALRRFDGPELLRTLRSVSWKGLLVYAAMSLVGTALRSLRLRVFLGGEPRPAAVWQSVVLGYLGGQALPLGAGELVRLGALRSLAGVSFLRALSGSLLDRLLEAAGIAISLCVLALGGPRLGLNVRTLAILGAAFAGTIGGIALVGVMGSRVLPPRVAAHPLGRPWGARLDEIRTGLRAILRPRSILTILLLQGLIWSADLAGVLGLLRAFPPLAQAGWDLALRLYALAMVALALPILPGAAGTQQTAFLLALAGACSANQALAVSLAAQGLTFLLAGIQGAAAVLAAPRHLRSGLFRWKGSPPIPG